MSISGRGGTSSERRCRDQGLTGGRGDIGLLAVLARERVDVASELSREENDVDDLMWNADGSEAD